MFIAKQPIVDIRTRSVFAFELLCRNRDDQFIPPPEQHIFWASIDRKILELAKQLIPAGPHITINVSEATLADDRFFEAWAKRVAEKSIDGPLTVEITENVTDLSLAHRWRQLKELPAMLSLDDFGRDYNQLSRLQQYEWDCVKFEMGITDAMTFNEIQLAGLKETLDRGVPMIAERIETTAQAKAAIEMGFSLQQGYLWGQPTIVHATELMV